MKRKYAFSLALKNGLMAKGYPLACAKTGLRKAFEKEYSRMPSLWIWREYLKDHNRLFVIEFKFETSTLYLLTHHTLLDWTVRELDRTLTKQQIYGWLSTYLAIEHRGKIVNPRTAEYERLIRAINQNVDPIIATLVF